MKSPIGPRMRIIDGRITPGVIYNSLEDLKRDFPPEEGQSELKVREDCFGRGVKAYFRIYRTPRSNSELRIYLGFLCPNDGIVTGLPERRRANTGDLYLSGNNTTQYYCPFCYRKIGERRYR
jgi:hypothetical protein